MKNSLTSITASICEGSLLPLFTHQDPQVAYEVIQAAHKAGIRNFEFTNRMVNSLETFRFLISSRKDFPDLNLGVGTILDERSAKQYIEAGATFIVSPTINPKIAKACKDSRIDYIPGCATPTEISMALDYEVQLIKLFPGSVLGPAFVASIIPVFQGVRFLITGGVEIKEENLRSWFNSGATALGLGSGLFTPEIIRSRDWKSLQRIIENTISIIQKCKGEC